MFVSSLLEQRAAAHTVSIVLQDKDAGNRGLQACLSLMQAYDKCMTRAVGDAPVELYRVGATLIFGIASLPLSCMTIHFTLVGFTWPSLETEPPT